MEKLTFGGYLSNNITLILRIDLNIYTYTLIYFKSECLYSIFTVEERILYIYKTYAKTSTRKMRLDWRIIDVNIELWW